MKKIFLIPTLLAEESPIGMNFPADQLTLIRRITHFFVENEKPARRFLKRIYPAIDFGQIQLCPIGKHAEENEIGRFFAVHSQVQEFGVLSDAGYPCVADPGYRVVQYAHAQNIRVQPLIGPCSLFMLLAASGLNGQNFSFEGYLPIDRSACRTQLLAWQKQILQSGKTFLFIETPFRNLQTLEFLLDTLQTGLQLCIGCEITSPEENIRTLSLAHWRKQDRTYLHKKNVLFALGQPQ